MSRRFRHAAPLLTRRYGGEVIITASGRDDFEHLAGSATAVWDLLRVPRSLHEIVGVLSEAYGVPAERIEPEVGALLDEMRRRGLVEEVDAGAG